MAVSESATVYEIEVVPGRTIQTTAAFIAQLESEAGSRVTAATGPPAEVFDDGPQ
jgi:hypothetical protein